MSVLLIWETRLLEGGRGYLLEQGGEGGGGRSLTGAGGVVTYWGVIVATHQDR